MNDKEKKQKQIQLLQQNLCSIRKIAGWTAEQLGEKIGVTKQTISNLENSKSPMNLTQYIAIRSILDYEIESNPDNTVLPQVINILVDRGAELEEENYSEIKETVDTVAASASDGKTGASLAKIFTSLLTTPKGISALATLGIMLGQSEMLAKIAGATATGTANWLKKIIK
ncbi:helix-turn-helix transcriptional regulator [Phosphitispora fastidiosa]|uniref:helix-turn-helix transcriptional regulator n=1 Tax=Phosphitispora fastidiosa TaxID=2837202 RepID=UPI001E5776F4|nr:helix-turn-helix transcriptional regulator [Phosphitispora fastidiosa]MBU7006047.1 transcriptional regulator with XRE-family HTH domain [Phosphitispora fastidiosa]